MLSSWLCNKLLWSAIWHERLSWGWKQVRGLTAWISAGEEIDEDGKLLLSCFVYSIMYKLLSSIMVICWLTLKTDIFILWWKLSMTNPVFTIAKSVHEQSPCPRCFCCCWSYHALRKYHRSLKDLYKNHLLSYCHLTHQEDDICPQFI